MKYVLIAVMALGLLGCNNTTENTNITRVVQGDNGVYIYNEDGTTTYTSTIDYAGEEPTGEFDPADDATECRAKGYFYCELDNKCMPKKLEDGSCSTK